jgi:uncharacterized phage protein gp47/JayE
MNLKRPSLSELYESVKTNFVQEMRLKQILEKGFIFVTSKVLAGLQNISHGFLEFIYRQTFPNTSTGERLEAWATLVRTSRRPATIAIGEIKFTGEDGVTIPAGTITRSQITGNQYITKEEVIISSGEALVDVESVFPGSKYNLELGSQISIFEAIEGLDSEITVTKAITGGVDQEDDSQLQQRVDYNFKNPPIFGKRAYYNHRATQIPGVKTVYTDNNKPTPGSVTIYPLGYDVQNPLLADTQFDGLDQHLHEEEWEPLGVKIVLAQPTIIPVSFEISLEPNDPVTRFSVEQALKDFMSRDAKPGATLYISKIRETISNAAGEFNHELLQPTVNITSLRNQIHTFNGVTWS